MKILQIMAGAATGGAETFFMDGVKAIHEIGYQQHIITRPNSPYRKKTFENLTIPFESASFSNIIRWPTSSKIRTALRTFKPDIAHHWLGRAGSYAQEGAHVNIGWYGGYYDPKYYKHCTHHVAVTRDIADHLMQKGVPSQNVHVLHLYAVCEPADKLNRHDFDTPEDAPLLLSLARLHNAKGLDILLQSLSKIPEAYLWLAGTGPLEHALKEQVKALKLDRRVRFLGWRTDREALLATADICVFPSRYEPFGAVFIEAWAAGTPVISTKSQGPKAFIKHEHDGVLVDIDDIDGLAHSIQHIINNPDLARSMATEGLKSYHTHFTKDVFKQNVRDLYASVLPGS